MSLISLLGRLRQADFCGFTVNLAYIVRPYLEKQNKTEKHPGKGFKSLVKVFCTAKGSKDK